MVTRLRLRLRALCISVALTLAALGLAACTPTSGTVTGKRYEPAREWTTLEPDYDKKCTNKGATRSCTTVLDGYAEKVHRVDECYRLDLKNGGAVGSVCVDRETYEHVQVGDRYEEGK